MNEFKLTVHLKKNIFKKKMSKKIFYYRNDYFDEAVFEKNTITISGNRTKKIDYENFLFTPLSTCYQDIVKVLLYTYFSYGSFEIDQIVLTGTKKKINIKNIFQSFIFEMPYKKEINPEVLDLIFQNNHQAETLMRSLMYLILSLDPKKNQLFENTWKSFNVLLKSTTKQENDFNMLRDMRTYIENNTSKFQGILKFADTIDISYLAKCRINAMIKNNHPQLKPQKQHKEADDVIKRVFLNYSDVRLCQILKEKMTSKKKVLEAQNLYEQTEKDLTQLINNNEKVNTDIIRFLLLKYAYYLRCKYFHAEKWASGFLFSNQESEELDRISEPIQIIIFDMINAKTWI